MSTTVTVTTDQPTPAAPTVVQQAIAAQEPKPELAPGEVAPEVIVGATPAPNSFAEDDALLAKLEGEQAVKDAAKATTGTPSPAPAVAAPAGTPAVAAPAVVAPNPQLSAIIALRKQNAELAGKNLILEGERRALSSMIAPAGQPAPAVEPGPVVDPEMEGIESEYEAIAKQVDDGDLSNVEAEKLRRDVRSRERAILEDRVASVAATPVNDLGLQEHLGTLITDYPVLNRLSKAHLEEFEQKAYAKALLEDNPIPSGPVGTKRLREEMAMMAERKYDPAAAQARAARKTGNGGTAPAGAPAAAAAPTAQQREAKLQAAGNMPPDIGNIGAAAVGGEMTAAQGEAIFNSLKGEDEQIRWLEQHPAFVTKVMGNSMPSR